MARLILNLDAETASRLQEAAELAGLTKDEWLIQLIKEQLGKSWPDSLRQLSGAWPDFPDAETLRE